MYSEELLIESVRQYPSLYDASDANYHDSKTKDNAWKEISRKFDDWTVAECRKRWVALRDSFRKAYRKRRLSNYGNGQAAKRMRPWKFENAISFIIPHITERNPTSELNVDSEDSNAFNVECVKMEKDGDTTEFNEDFNEDVDKEMQQFNYEAEVPPKPRVASKVSSAIDFHPTAALLEYFETKNNKTEERKDALCAFFEAMEATEQVSAPPTLWGYPGILKIVEEIVNIYIIVSLVVVGSDEHAYYLFLVAMLSFLLTALFLLISLLELVTEMSNSCYWIEFTYCLASGISLGLSSTLVLASMSKGYILICLFGYLNSSIYLADSLNKYRMAVNSRTKVYWSRPLEFQQNDE